MKSITIWVGGLFGVLFLIFAPIFFFGDTFGRGIDQIFGVMAIPLGINLIMRFRNARATRLEAKREKQALKNAS